MIRPDEIRRKAENLYPRFLRAWLAGEVFFPKSIPARKQPTASPAAAIEEVQRLRAAAKESLGYGYTIVWKEINSRRHGRNLFPGQILFETQEDFLRFIGKQREFQTFADAVQLVHSQFPQLLPWVQSHRKQLLDKAGELEGLLHVVHYLRQRPSPPSAC